MNSDITPLKNQNSLNLRSKSHERFVALAEKRVTKAIKDLRLIGNLSNKSNYNYNKNETKIIIKTLQKELNKVKEKFYSITNNEEDISFKF